MMPELTGNLDLLARRGRSKSINLNLADLREVKDVYTIRARVHAHIDIRLTAADTNDLPDAIFRVDLLSDYKHPFPFALNWRPASTRAK
jgi:hypothetical protein